MDNQSKETGNEQKTFPWMDAAEVRGGSGAAAGSGAGEHGGRGPEATGNGSPQPDEDDRREVDKRGGSDAPTGPGGPDVPSRYEREVGGDASGDVREREATVLAAGHQGPPIGRRIALGAAFQQVQIAVAEAEEAHGPLTPNVERASLILGEEYGEAIKEACDYTREGSDRGNWAKLILELAQTAATATLMIENLIKEHQ